MTEIISMYYKYTWVWNNVFFALGYAINIVTFWFLTTVFTQNEDWLFKVKLLGKTKHILDSIILPLG